MGHIPQKLGLRVYETVTRGIRNGSSPQNSWTNTTDKSENIRRADRVENVHGGMLRRKMKWYKHKGRTDNRKLVRTSRDKSAIDHGLGDAYENNGATT